MNNTTQTNLSLWLAAPPDAGFTPVSLPLGVIFHNHGPAAVVLLRHFDPAPVFFAVSLVQADGTPLSLLGAGKIEFLDGTMRFLTLEPQELFGTVLDLARMSPAGSPIAPGPYAVSVTYHNQYGDQAFQGSLTSNTLHIEVHP